MKNQIPKFHKLSHVDASNLLPEFFKPEHPPDLCNAWVKEAGNSGEHVLVFPSLGAIPRHILVAPETGSYNSGNTSLAMRRALFATAQEVRFCFKDLTDSYPLLVEHGAAPSSTTSLTPDQKSQGAHIGCACVDHPHIHLIDFPSHWKIRFTWLCEQIGGPADLNINTIRKLGKLHDKPYLLMSRWKNDLIAWLNPREKFGRQFIRRAVWYLYQTDGDAEKALSLLRSDPKQDWNWRVNPGFDVMRKTNQTLDLALKYGYIRSYGSTRYLLSTFFGKSYSAPQPWLHPLERELLYGTTTQPSSPARLPASRCRGDRNLRAK